MFLDSGGKYEIEFYKDNGKMPVQLWINNLDYGNRFQIEARLAKIRNGNLGDIKSVSDQIYELRFFFGAGYRIYFALVDNRMILLLQGGNKNTQVRDIKIAKIRFIKYQSEKRYGIEE